MVGYLLDTNVVSELRKIKPHGGVLAWLSRQNPSWLFISAITIGELQAGVERTRPQDEKKAREIEAWIEGILQSQQILPMDAHCLRAWARLMEGKSNSLVEDAMIAATAHVHSLTVVSRDEKDFGQLGVNIINPFKIP
jgi:toxin FitB